MALLSLLWRIFIFLKDGFWLNSLCSLTADLATRFSFETWCKNEASWIGIREVSNWLLLEVDASLTLLVYSVIWLIAALLVHFVLRFFDPQAKCWERSN
jgi:hypothetical protein